MSTWKQNVDDVRENGFAKAAPLSRLVWSCEVGQINQHASDDLKAIMDEIESLRRRVEAAEKMADQLEVDNPNCAALAAWEEAQR
jgi:hypothetical protein